jgi:phage FluMu protein Com
MPFTIQCSKCQKTLKVPDEAAGKKVRCPSCQEVIAVPAAQKESPPEEAVTPAPAAPTPSTSISKTAAWDNGKDEDDDADKIEDDSRVSSGKMDPSGRSSTSTGKVCAIIGIVIGIINAIAGVIINVSQR